MTTEGSASRQASPSDFAWTTGDDATISHVRKIAAGAYGEVHEVFRSL
jgi:hypothetical protein